MEMPTIQNILQSLALQPSAGWMSQWWLTLSSGLYPDAGFALGLWRIFKLPYCVPWNDIPRLITCGILKGIKTFGKVWYKKVRGRQISVSQVVFFPLHTSFFSGNLLFFWFLTLGAAADFKGLVN